MPERRIASQPNTRPTAAAAAVPNASPSGVGQPQTFSAWPLLSPRPGATPLLDARGEAHLVAVACSKAPEGRETWKMQLIADRLVELGIVESISGETVRRRLKKTNSSPGRRSSGASPE